MLPEKIKSYSTDSLWNFETNDFRRLKKNNGMCYKKILIAVENPTGKGPFWVGKTTKVNSFQKYSAAKEEKKQMDNGMFNKEICTNLDYLDQGRSNNDRQWLLFKRHQKENHKKN